MKKTVIIILIVIVLITGLYFGLKYYKKYKNLNYLVPELNDFSFDWAGKNAMQIVTDISDRSTTANLSLKIKNFSDSKYTVNSLFVKVYSMNDTYIGGQINPYTDTIEILPNSEIIVNLKIDLSTAGITQLAKQLGNIGLLQLATNYYTKGIIGTQIKLKGNLSAEGLKVLSIPIDETIDI